jgi:hypothetical protein
LELQKESQESWKKIYELNEKKWRKAERKNKDLEKKMGILIKSQKNYEIELNKMKLEIRKEFEAEFQEKINQIISQVKITQPGEEKL